MITKNDYPILDFDDVQDALINPETVGKDLIKFDCHQLIITFFGEALEKLLSEGLIKPYMKISGENAVMIYKFVDSNVLIIHGYVGCPACAGDLDLLHYLGATKVMFCGGGGVLDPSIAVGQIMVVEGAIRDEGFSYHYLPPARYVYANERVNDTIVSYLERNAIPFIKGIAWTTDALFRETKERIALRRSEGAKIVEMEQAGCLAVAQFRNFDYGALLYGGDDVSSETWDKRQWRSRQGVRYDLIMLCKELVQLI